MNRTKRNYLEKSLQPSLIIFKKFRLSRLNKEESGTLYYDNKRIKEDENEPRFSIVFI